MNGLFLRNLEEHLELFASLRGLEVDVEWAAAAVAEAMRSGGKLLLCGNGGSAADCQHIAAEFTGRFIDDRRPLPAIALSTDTSALTCISNDYAFEQVFSRQVQALGRAGDCLLGISTSGNSRNVLAAVAAAKEAGMMTIGLAGRDGGRLRSACDRCIVVPSGVTARIQEAHILIGHTLCGAVEQRLGLVSVEGGL